MIQVIHTAYSDEAIPHLSALANAVHQDIVAVQLRFPDAGWYAIIAAAIDRAAEIGAKNPRTDPPGFVTRP